MAFKFPLIKNFDLTPGDTPYQKLLNSIKKDKRTAYSKDSLLWFNNKVKKFFGKSDDNSALSLPEKQIEKFAPEWLERKTKTGGTKKLPGFFYTFTYNPKGKKTLPYYDRFPMVLCLSLPENGSFLGINFHYIYPRDRAFFFDELSRYKRFDDVQGDYKINITYDILKKTNRLAYYKPCIKRYLINNIGSIFIPIYEDEWVVALFLPTESFEKKSMKNVHEISKRTYKSLV